MMRRILSTAVLLAALGPEARADEEPPPPIPHYVVDLRAAYMKLPTKAELTATNVVPPTIGLGFVGGVQFYPLRWKTVTFGIGGEYAIIQGRHQPTPDEAPGPPLKTQFHSLAPQVSFNFGHRAGWSYISAGIANATIYTQSGETNLVNSPDQSLKTINYGVGARWFFNDHMAFCVDGRVYAVNPGKPAGTVFGSGRLNQLQISAGFSFR